MIMFVVYTIMLLRYQEDMWIVYDEYPETVVYLISATAKSFFKDTTFIYYLDINIYIIFDTAESIFT